MKELEDLVSRGAILRTKHGFIMPLGAVLVRGNTIVWALQWAEDQHHVHRTDGITLKAVSPDMIDWWESDGRLFGTLELMDSEEAAQCRLQDWHRRLADPELGPRWRRFFESEVAQLLQD